MVCTIPRCSNVTSLLTSSVSSTAPAGIPASPSSFMASSLFLLPGPPHRDDFIHPVLALVRRYSTSSFEGGRAPFPQHRGRTQACRAGRDPSAPPPDVTQPVA